MRQVNNQDMFTPFGLWIREYGPPDISVTNLDYVINDYKRNRLMLFEEKQSGGNMHYGQYKVFDVLDSYMSLYGARSLGIDYWGFYMLQMPPEKTMVGPGLKLNGRNITVEQLQRHISFQEKIVPRCYFPWMEKYPELFKEKPLKIDVKR
jgi:hypothetical protein